MNTPVTSQLWAKVVQMARDGVDPVQAFRKIRADGGRDLTKDDDEFTKIYERLKAMPLFARNMVLTLRRKELQEAVVNAVLSVDVEHDDQVDDVLRTLREYEDGSFHALLKCIERVEPVHPELAASLLENARTLWPAVFRQLEDQEAAARANAQSPAPAQLSLPGIDQPISR